MPIVNYESNLDQRGLQDLLDLLGRAASLEGDTIECGSSRCGTSLIMAKYMRSLGDQRLVYALDSFEGFNPKELETERALGSPALPDDSFKSTSFDYVRQKISKLGFENTVIPVKGFFEETLPGLITNKRFSLAFIDCDLKDCMTYCAERLWPTIVPGGIMAFDHYLTAGLKGARLAVDGFVS